jgi:multiple sugar transport system ATP-binding protein
MTMGNRVAVMRKGELQQVADPKTLYDHPVNLFVGGFIGSPAMNLVEATLANQNGRVVANIGEETIAIEADEVKARPGLADYAGREIVLGIRPEDLEDAALVPSSPDEQRLHGKVELIEALGSEVVVHFTIKAKHAITEEVLELAEDVGDERAIDEAADSDSAMLVGRFGARSRVSAGQTIEVAVDTRSLHFFDLHTGLGIYDASTAQAAQ